MSADTVSTQTPFSRRAQVIKQRQENRAARQKTRQEKIKNKEGLIGRLLGCCQSESTGGSSTCSGGGCSTSSGGGCSTSSGGGCSTSSGGGCSSPTESVASEGGHGPLRLIGRFFRGLFGGCRS